MTQGHPKAKAIDLSKVRYIISDWDGTFVDSIADYTEAFSRSMSEKYGISSKRSETYYRSTFGSVLTDQIKEAAQNLRVDR